MPRASPSLRRPAGKQRTVAICMLVVHIFCPLMIQPLTLSRVAWTALVSICVASEPCSGSVRPNVMRYFPVIELSIIAFWSAVP